MTYARSRLWLGITGVGSLVVLATTTLFYDLPSSWFSLKPVDSLTESTELLLLTAVVATWLLPLDFLGGFWLPRKFGRSKIRFSKWIIQYACAVVLQATLFVAFGMAIIAASRVLGVPGAMLAVICGLATCVVLRDWMLGRRKLESAQQTSKMVDALAIVRSWNIVAPKTLVVDHRDPGFTGGIVGLGKRVKIVIPRTWLRFSTEQLATAIARRSLAIQNGSYLRGLLAALLWNFVGFFFMAWLSSSDLASVAGLATTACWFTLWTFLGLLTLPTLSRKSSLCVDRELLSRGGPRDWILSTTHTMDQLQDGEPERPPIIETIFHPIPSVASRTRTDPVTGVGAWNVARTTLFFSWAFLGFLSRAVHCNVGRPELWTMLPSD